MPLLALTQAAPQKQPKVADGGCFPTAHTLNYSASPQRPYLPSGVMDARGSDRLRDKGDLHPRFHLSRVEEKIVWVPRQIAH